MDSKKLYLFAGIFFLSLQFIAVLRNVLSDVKELDRPQGFANP